MEKGAVDDHHHHDHHDHGEKRKDAKPVPPPRPAPVTSMPMSRAPERRLTVTKVKGPPCHRCTRPVHTSELQKVRTKVATQLLTAWQDGDGHVFHQACLSCADCKASLSGGTAFQQHNGALLCDAPGSVLRPRIVPTHLPSTGCFAKATAATPAAPVAPVVKAHCCEVCGAGLDGTGGSTHAECAQSGRALFPRQMSARQAFSHVPRILSIRVFVNTKWFTFFLARPSPPSAQDRVEEEYVSVAYAAEASAFSPAVRACPVAESDDAVIDCEGLADCAGFVLRGELAFEGSDDVLTAHITHGKYALSHDLAVRCAVCTALRCCSLNAASCTTPLAPHSSSRAPRSQSSRWPLTTSTPTTVCRPTPPMCARLCGVRRSRAAGRAQQQGCGLCARDARTAVRRAAGHVIHRAQARLHAAFRAAPHHIGRCPHGGAA